MITQQTLLVLGAGASTAYGFPTGQDLRGVILHSLNRHDQQWVDLLQQCGFDFDLITKFRNDLADSPRPSVDAFLSSRRNEYLEIGKHAIAMFLLPCENDDNVRGPSGADWMRYLFDRLMPSRPEDLARNRVNILTFNFDRSFERVLWLALKAEYGRSDDETREYAKILTPVHVHGDLGLPAWLDPSGTAYGGALTKEAITQAARRIKIVFEEIPDRTKVLIRQFMTNAERIAFLGFGYAEDNLIKLGLPDHVTRNIPVSGTSRGIETGELAIIKSRLDPLHLLTDATHDILQFLRRTDVLHG